MRNCAFFAACLLFLSASFAQAEFYRWIDRDGREFYTNEREKVPLEYQSIAEEVQPDESRLRVGKKVVATEKRSAPLAEHKDKYGRGANYWHKRVVKLRKELAALQVKYDLLMKQEKDDDEKLSQLTDDGSRRKIQAAQAKRTRRKATLERSCAKKKYDLEVALPDEARKAEAYPGWLRE